MQIVVTAGIPAKNWLSARQKRNEDFIRFERGELLVVDWSAEPVVARTIDYVSPAEQRHPAVLFKGGEVRDDCLNIVTNSEIVVYDRATLEVVQTVTHPHFTDLHGVLQVGNEYWVANTGLEVVQRVDRSGKILAEHNMAETPTWERFDRDTDYRFVGSTKPHTVHVNHVFVIDGEFFATRFKQRDAVSLSDPARRFAVDVGNPHDGVVRGGRVYFTTTNGHVLVFAADTRELIKCLDVNEILERSGFMAGGWCRGVCPLADGNVIIGFTKLRDSKFKEYGAWIKNLGRGRKSAPSRLVEIDLEREAAVRELAYPNGLGAAVFSVLGFQD